MHRMKRRIETGLLFCFLFAHFLIAAAPSVAQTASRRFTVADDIALSQFWPEIVFSPDERFFIVISERGRLDLNRIESTLRVYSSEEIRKVLSAPDSQQEPSPLWSILKSTYKEGPIISDVRWLDDSSGFMFLAKTESGKDQLFLANPHAKTVKALTDEDESVRAFAVRSETQFVYLVPSPTLKQKVEEEQQAASIVGTGQDLWNLIFPQKRMDYSDLCELWAVVDGRRFRVIDRSTQHPVAVHSEGFYALALSPDGHSLVTALTVPTIPPEWETLYAPPTPSDPYRIRAGRQDPNAVTGVWDVDEYVLIDLTNGSVKPLVNAPTGYNSGWGGMTTADWSADGKSVVMSTTFLPGNQQMGANRPCVAMADLATGKIACVERRPKQTEQDREEKWEVDSVRFVSGKSDQMIVRYAVPGSMTYVRSPDGTWSAEGTRSESWSQNHALDVQIKQDMNHPPVLVAADTQGKNSRTVWNPNPQLKDIQLSEVSLFKWKDKNGRAWEGGLYKPPDFSQGRRYPLVIQTHGFDEHTFIPSGIFTTAFAAQELAAVGFVVLQLEDCHVAERDEGTCQVAGYEAAVQELTAQGLVDPDRVGIIGFSRSCYYVMEALTTSTLHFKAASITDGLNKGYLQYLTWLDGVSSNIGAHDMDASMGAAPFGSGLQQWISRSPEFNMDKVQTALQVVALSRENVLDMWEPYAALRYLNRPVDLLVVGSSQHILTNPAARMASQGGTVDWFRFWLKGEEDPSPDKAGEYVRWRNMRQQQLAASHAKAAEASPGH